eukprot:4672756-Prymnesium_polylepis.2
MTAAALPEQPRRGRAASQGPPPPPAENLRANCPGGGAERRSFRRRPSASREMRCLCVIAFDGASDGVYISTSDCSSVD